jgi:hypothetical protein
MMMGSQPVCQMGPAYTSQGFHVSLTSSISNSKEDTSPTCSVGVPCVFFLSGEPSIPSPSRTALSVKQNQGKKTVKP